MNCIFCKIINGEIPSYKIYEDDDFLAFLDISQATKGHTLLVPKKHYANILEMDDTTASKALVIVKQLAQKIVTKLNADGVNILNNNGSAAGQTVDHVHFHIIPRYANDNLVITFTNNSQSIDLQEIQSAILSM